MDAFISGFVKAAIDLRGVTGLLGVAQRPSSIGAPYRKRQMPPYEQGRLRAQHRLEEMLPIQLRSSPYFSGGNFTPGLIARPKPRGRGELASSPFVSVGKYKRPPTLMETLQDMVFSEHRSPVGA